MFLKSLEIRGFKSFADKTELKFRSGVTAVVGPNGSGKSNISDAVRWVLGEQSIKTLRGGKMEDVIFAGTQYRKPVGLAQVSLTLDNQDGILASDYNEVTVSRRIFRSGESEYLINNTKCRLKDVTNLFMDTGIGKEGYSLIGQGKIDAILSGRPEDRRMLLEEAAGIVKYKYRKSESEKKLSNTDDNLIRIRDIISTYEERLEPLRIEREKALKFRDLSEELKGKEISVLVRSIKILEEEVKAFNEDLKNRQNILEKKREELISNRNSLREIENKIEKLESKTTEEKLEYFTKKEEITKSKSDIELYEERIKNFNGILEKNKLEEYGINSKIKDIHIENEILKKELLLRKEEQKARESEILEGEEKNRELIRKLNKVEEELSFLKKSEFDLLKGNSEINNTITEINGVIKSKEESIERVRKNISNTENNIKLNTATLNSLKIKIKSNEEDLELLKSSVIEDKQKLSRLNGNISKKETTYRGTNISLSKLEAKEAMLKDLENQYEGYNRSLKNLMEKIDKKETPDATGTKVLGEIFEVKKEYEIAIETALGGGISNVITETDKIAKDLVSYLKKNKLGRITFLPLNIIKSNKIQLNDNIKNLKGYIGIASEIVKFDDKYKRAIEYVLGRTIIADSMDSAFNIAKLTGYKNRIVTLEGEVLNAGGALTGGSIKGKTSSILSRRRELEEIESLILKEKETLNTIADEINSLKETRKQLDDDILNKTDKVHGIKIELATSKNELLNISNEINKLKGIINSFNLENDKNLKDIEELKIQREEHKETLDKLMSENNLNKKRVLELEGILIDKKDELEKFKEELTNLKISKASIDETLQFKINEIKRKEEEILQNNEKISKITLENEQSKSNVEEAKIQIIKSEERIVLNTQRIEELEKIFKEDEIIKGKLKEEFKVIDSLITEMREIINKDEGELNKREIQKAKSDIEKENFYKKLNEELDLTYAEAVLIAKPIEDITKFKEEISLLKKRISSLGTVNLGSIEEYEEVKEKYEFMSTQEEDLEKAKKELLEVIDEMTRKMKKLFKENFKVLNKNFNETFKELFKGGSAELIIADGDELTANIDINVEPPGKKLQNINLMSGGEKVLSAIALLFAILKMKPTPFCILDEIEAALDDANVFRYAEFLKKFSENIQFIVITHRKGTMEVSDVMYGVTMEEKGISKVVSVDLTN